MNTKNIVKIKVSLFFVLIVLVSFISHGAVAADLEDVLKSGTLRHLGIPYANFVTTDLQGLDVELQQQFAKYLGVEYEFVKSTWSEIIPSLTGKTIEVVGDHTVVTGTTPIKGDVISTGFTVLPWRKTIVDFSDEAFPSGIWLIAGEGSTMTPISPSGNIDTDIALVKKSLAGVSVLGLNGSCLAPSLYGIAETGAKVKFFPENRDLEEMIPSVMAKMADSTLMDVPVALIALDKWSRQIKVIGPISAPQSMACAFSKESPKLKQAFDKFFKEFKQSGKYRELVYKYYPTVFIYYPDFLSQE